MLHQQPGQEKRAKQPESIAVASNTWLQAVKVSMGSRDLVDLDLRITLKRGATLSLSLGFGFFLQKKTQRD